jgi:hypothetical protein
VPLLFPPDAEVYQQRLLRGLVGWWNFNQGSIMASTVYDRSGRRHHGTMTGNPSVIVGRRGHALKFDGVDDLVTITRTAALEPAALTLAAWFRPDGTQQGEATIVRKDWQNNGAPSYVSYGLQMNSGGADPTQVTFYLGISGNLAYVQSSTGILASGTWVHVVGTQLASATPPTRLYINGVFKSSSPASTTAAIVYDAAMPVTIGGMPRAIGVIDDVRIYNRALPAETVMDLYRATAVGMAGPGTAAPWWLGMATAAAELPWRWSSQTMTPAVQRAAFW